ncbi:hypothetical protein [Endozoicomonas sp. 2B-B]
MKKQDLQAIVVIDGIEDLFPNVGDVPEEAQAIKNCLNCLTDFVRYATALQVL